MHECNSCGSQLEPGTGAAYFYHCEQGLLIACAPCVESHTRFGMRLRSKINVLAALAEIEEQDLEKQ